MIHRIEGRGSAEELPRSSHTLTCEEMAKAFPGPPSLTGGLLLPFLPTRIFFFFFFPFALWPSGGAIWEAVLMRLKDAALRVVRGCISWPAVEVPRGTSP